MSAFIHRYTFDAPVLRTWGEVTLSDEEKLAIESLRGTPDLAGIESRPFSVYAALRPSSSEDCVVANAPTYPLDADLTISFPVRAMKALSVIPVARVYVSEPSGTTVRLRAKTSANSYVWDGDSWNIAGGSDWSTPDELEEGLPTWPYKELGFVAKLQTTKVTKTPKFYGVLAGTEFEFRSGYSSVDDDMPFTQFDDLLHRTLVGSLRTGPTFDGVAEFEATDGQTEIDYSSDSSMFDRKVEVTEITAVYDVTDDPSRAAALAGTWDGASKVFTLDDPATEGHVLHVEFTYTPTIAFTGESDWYEESFPFIHVMGPEQTATETPPSPDQLVFPDGDDVWVVPAPERHSVGFRLRFVAEHDAEVLAMREAVRDWIGAAESLGGYGRTLLSDATALPVHIQWGDELANLERRGDGYEQHFRLVVQRWMYLHTATTQPTATQIEIGA